MKFKSIESVISKHGALIILLLGTIAFLPTLRVGFMWDDHEMIEANPKVHDITPKNILSAFSGDVFDGKGDAYFRPLQTLSNMWDYRLWNGRSIGFHLTNLFFHLAASFFVLLLFRRIWTSQFGAFLIAALFAVNPVVVEQLLIIAGRAEIMAAAFSFMAVYASGFKGPRAYWITLFLFVLSLLSKETGIMTPLLIFLVGWYRPSFRWPLKKYVPMGFILLVYLVIRQLAVGPVNLNVGLGGALLFLVRELPAILVHYFRLLIAPYDLHSHRRMIFPLWYILVTGWGILLAAVFFGYIKKKRPIFISGWFLISLFPKIPLLASNGLMLDHWIYPAVPAIGMVVVSLSEWIGRKLKNQFSILILPCVCLVAWILLGWNNIRHRNTEEKLYLWALNFPSSSVVRYNLGLIYFEQGKLELARELFEASLDMNPNNPVAGNGLALIHQQLGERDKAIEILTHWIHEAPGHIQSYLNRAYILRGADGLLDIETALTLQPNYERAWVIKAEILYELNRIEEAKAAYQKVLSINTRNLQALVDLGTLNGIQGNFDLARSYWIRALGVDPDNPTALKNLRWLAQSGFGLTGPENNKTGDQ